MALLNFLVNKDPLREQRDTAKQYAREMYDPSQLSPQLDFARGLAVEGIDDQAENIARRRTLQSLFGGQQFDLYGGGQGRAIAQNQQRTAQATQALGQFEGQLSQADIQAQQQGQQQYAQTRTQQEQLSAQRRAAMKEADLQYQAEVERRGQAIGQTVLGVAGAALTTPFGGGGSLASRGLGKVFGGEDTPDVGALLTETARAGVQTATPDDTPIQPEGLDLGEISWGESGMYSIPDGEVSPRPQTTMEVPSMLQRGNDQEQGYPYAEELFGQMNEGSQQVMEAFNYPEPLSLQEFINQENLDAASGFQNYEGEITMEEFENSPLGKLMYLFGQGANEFVSTFNPFLNLMAIGRGQQQKAEQRYRQQLR